LSSYKKDVITYIAGFVEKKIIAKLDCSECRNEIIEGEKGVSVLLNLKNRGKLTVPEQLVR